MRSIRSFYELAPHRVREVLFVSSEYDAFVLDTEGQMAERLFFTYSEFFMIGSPRISTAFSVDQALEVMAARRVDLVVCALRSSEADSLELIQGIERVSPDTPVVLLVMDASKMHRSVEAAADKAAGVFLWTGDINLMTAIFNHIEDRLNVDADTGRTGVQVIITVEDTVSDYSNFLPMLYRELMEQSRRLYGEGVNFAQRMLRMLARPKILMASDYDEAKALFDKYRSHVLALISDVRFSCRGRSESDAGFRLAEYCVAKKPNLRVLLQSSESGNAEKAGKRGWQFAYKKPEQLKAALHLFLEESLGFGDFVFRMPDRTEVARAKDTYELERLLHVVNLRSIYYHAYNNHFNVWLRARNCFELADEVEHINASDFASEEELRNCLISVLHKHSEEEYQGVVADFSRRSVSSSHNLFRVGSGSIGGKGRGIAFASSLLAKSDFIDIQDGLNVSIPRSVVLGVDVYDRFMEINGFSREAQGKFSDSELMRIYLEARLPAEIIDELKDAVDMLNGPLAVRSSSLLEDSQNQSCAGIYATYMVPDNHSDSPGRFELICRAVKMVYMSAVSSKARTYLENSNSLGKEEKMAVIIQELVGALHGRYFYPHFSGVAMSNNFYPMGPQRSEDGVAVLALGLGSIIAEGGRCVRFSPKWPKVLPHLYHQNKFLEYSQKDFYAVEINGSSDDNPSGMVKLKLKQAEEDGTLEALVSVLGQRDCNWRDSLMYKGARAVTFDNILAWNSVPLAKTLDELLERFKVAIGCPVELEFAVDLIPSSCHSNEFLSEVQSDPEPDGAPPVPTLYILQIRPLTDVSIGEEVRSCGYEDDELLCSCDSLGNGVIDDIKDIIFVNGTSLGRGAARAAAAAVGCFNAELMKNDRPYLLVGPGRWGSLDPNLGIPVQTGQILGAKVIVELPYGSRFVEPSMGSHFFHELASMRIGYMTVCTSCGEKLHEDMRDGNCVEQPQMPCILRRGKDFCDTEWLGGLPAAAEIDGVRHICLAQPLRVFLNGRCCRGAVLKSSIK